MASQVARHPEAFSLDGRRSKQKRPRVHADDHLKWLRTLPCVVTGARGVEAAHIRFADARYRKPAVGMAEKPDDRWALPLSPGEHRRQHSMNEQAYWQSVGIDPVFVAMLLWNNTGDDEEGEAIIRQFSVKLEDQSNA